MARLARLVALAVFAAGILSRLGGIGEVAPDLLRHEHHLPSRQSATSRAVEPDDGTSDALPAQGVAILTVDAPSVFLSGGWFVARPYRLPHDPIPIRRSKVPPPSDDPSPA